MKGTKTAVYMRVGDYQFQKLAVYNTEEKALQAKQAFEREDRQEIAEGYGFPYGIPEYILVRV